jgi:hypothetical protein
MNVSSSFCSSVGNHITILNTGSRGLIGCTKVRDSLGPLEKSEYVIGRDAWTKIDD